MDIFKKKLRELDNIEYFQIPRRITNGLNSYTINHDKILRE